MKRNEAVTEEDLLSHKYSVIVSFANGYHRGYMIEAEDADAMMEKLHNHIKSTMGLAGIQNIAIAEILLDGDVIK